MTASLNLDEKLPKLTLITLTSNKQTSGRGTLKQIIGLELPIKSSKLPGKCNIINTLWEGLQVNSYQSENWVHPLRPKPSNYIQGEHLQLIPRAISHQPPTRSQCCHNAMNFQDTVNTQSSPIIWYTNIRVMYIKNSYYLILIQRQ